MPWAWLGECLRGSVPLSLWCVHGDWTWQRGSVHETGPWLFFPPPIHSSFDCVLLLPKYFLYEAWDRSLWLERGFRGCIFYLDLVLLGSSEGWWASALDRPLLCVHYYSALVIWRWANNQHQHDVRYRQWNNMGINSWWREFGVNIA